MSWPYKKVLVIGATSGIGEALAVRCIEAGSHVIVSGRREEKLVNLVHQHGEEKATAAPFDITALDQIPEFASNIIKNHPDLDCIILNSGIQRGVDFTKPESINLGEIQKEFTTNYLSYVALTKAFLPVLQSRTDDSALIYTSSGLALVPILRCPNYCASKAALHHFLLVLREQLSESRIKIIEIFPPAVQTELHDAKHQPDIENGGSIGIPLAQFIDEAFAGLVAGKEEIAVGTANGWYEAFEPQRQETFRKVTAFMKQQGGS